MALSSIFMAIPLALILSNVVLWLVRPLRHAHQTAFDGVLSFRQGNYQLALTALVFLPFFLIAATVGIWDPWLAP